MVPLRHRLKLRQSPSFFKTAQRFSTKYFTVYRQPAEKLKLAVIIPKKNGFNAVARHRLKRQLNQVLVATQADQPWALAIITRKVSPTYEVTTLLSDLNQIWRI